MQNKCKVKNNFYRHSVERADLNIHTCKLGFLRSWFSEILSRLFFTRYYFFNIYICVRVCICACVFVYAHIFIHESIGVSGVGGGMIR